MLDFTAKILVKALQYITPQDILDGTVRYDAVPVRRLREIYFHSENDMTETDLSRKLGYLKEWAEFQLGAKGWSADARPAESDGWQEDPDGQVVGIFDLVHCLISKMLTVSHGRMVYRYKYLETWHYLSGKMGRNLFAAGAFALKDYREAVERGEFRDTDIIYHDNQTLNEILDRGMSENHFHLHGSAPYFLLSWLSLMNSVTITDTVRLLDQINEKPRNPKVRYHYHMRQEKFSVLHLKAAAIRIYLYAQLSGQMIELGEYYAPVAWLLDHILDTEPVSGAWFLREEENRPAGKFLQELSGNRLEYLKKYCQGFYWFFWQCFPDIPLGILKTDCPVFERENRSRIARYVSRNYEPLLLRRCAWLFTGNHQETFQREWKRQTRSALDNILKHTFEWNMADIRLHIQHVIDGFHACSRRQYKDYALDNIDPRKPEEWHQVVLLGERRIIYEMERLRFYEKKQETFLDDLYNLFFIYLVIKESFRSELLQNNDKIGFHNFQTYQKRKNWFTTSFTRGELAKIAVNEAFHSQNLQKLEIRVMPQNSGTDNIQMIYGYDKTIGMICGSGEVWDRNIRNHGENEPDYYYVFHFAKKKDDTYRDGRFRCRHDVFRRRLEQQAEAVISMRVRNPRAGRRLKGIDACSSEDGCRPEVFAVIFRRLKLHTVYRCGGNRNLPQLRASYHVGEENQDVLDGLRAIDEALYFLNLGSGDRLGHALMLGVSPEEWYGRNNDTIAIRQQDYLDNMVWLYHRMLHYHISNNENLLEYLEREFQKYFNRIYERNLNIDYYIDLLKSRGYGTGSILQFNIHNYYYAWELRGDDPVLYAQGFYNSRLLLDTRWDDRRINQLVNPERRKIEEAAVLYHAYHYNEAVRREGNKPVVEKIPRYMVHGIALLQKAMQKEIARKGIAIETNPSSNLMIGGLRGYDSHPVVSFNNKWLVSGGSEADDCPRINVSVNTDDLGVFTTTLYKEYTLMAYALEHKKDRTGRNVYQKDMVYDWIDHVRQMGNAQSFSRERMLGDMRQSGCLDVDERIRREDEWF